MSYYIGIDGGASKTRGVLIDNLGKTLSKIEINKGSNLKENENEAPKILIDLVIDLCTNNSISLTEVNAFGFGLALHHMIMEEKSYLKSLIELVYLKILY